jgi:hypothetical protein
LRVCRGPVGVAGERRERDLTREHVADVFVPPFEIYIAELSALLIFDENDAPRLTISPRRGESSVVEDLLEYRVRDVLRGEIADRARRAKCVT